MRKKVLWIACLAGLLGGCGVPEPVATGPRRQGAPADSVAAALRDTAATEAGTVSDGVRGAGAETPPGADGAEDRVAVQLARLDSLVARLDDRALIGQMFVVYRADNAFLLEHGFGGVLLFKSMLAVPGDLRAELDRLQAAAPVPYLVALDQEGGAVSRLDAVDGWQAGTPAAAEMAGWPLTRVRGEGRRIGRALASLGVNLNLAPVLDSAVAWDGQTSWMGFRGRAFGTDSLSIVPPARAFAAGCREAGVACVAKHFPGYDVTVNSDLEPARSGSSLADIRTAAARFHAVRGTVAGVMMASIVYPALAEAPAVLSPELVGLARRVVGHGLVMTDDLWGTALRAWRRPDLQILPAEYPDADWLALGELAVRAGNDLLLVTYPAKAALLQDLLAARLAEDPGLREAVTAAVRRIMLAKASLGLVAVD